MKLKTIVGLPHKEVESCPRMKIIKDYSYYDTNYDANSDDNQP